MLEMKCPNCGAIEWTEKDGFRKCAYCGTAFQAERKSDISLNSDVANLLKKCEEDPENAKKYAALILDIDPLNRKAKKILRGY